MVLFKQVYQNMDTAVNPKMVQFVERSVEYRSVVYKEENGVSSHRGVYFPVAGQCKIVFGTAGEDYHCITVQSSLEEACGRLGL